MKHSYLLSIGLVLSSLFGLITALPSLQKRGNSHSTSISTTESVQGFAQSLITELNKVAAAIERETSTFLATIGELPSVSSEYESSLYQFEREDIERSKSIIYPFMKVFRFGSEMVGMSVRGRVIEAFNEKWVKINEVNLGLKFGMGELGIHKFERDMDELSRMEGLLAVVVNATGHAYLRGNVNVLDLDDSKVDVDVTTYLLKDKKFLVSM